SDALQQAGGNISRAANLIGIPRSSLRYRLGLLGIGSVSRRLDAPGGPSPAPPPSPAHPAAHEAPPGRVPWEQRLVVILRALLSRSDHDTGADAWLIETLAAKVHGFGGHIEECDLAGLVAIFGAGGEDEAPSRAGHAALAMCRAVEQARDPRS